MVAVFIARSKFARSQKKKGRIVMSETPIPTTDGAVRGCGGMVVIVQGHEWTKICPWCQRPYHKHPRVEVKQ